MKSRWSRHKGDIRSGNWTACGLTRHFGENHQGDMEEAISALEVVLLDNNLFSEMPSVLSTIPRLRMVGLRENIMNFDEVGIIV